MSYLRIESIHNPRIKSIVKLQKRKEREKQNRFIIEGIKEIEKAIIGHYDLEQIYFCSEILSHDSLEVIIQNQSGVEIIELSKAVYQKIAYRESTEGILAISQPKSHTFDHIKLKENPLWLVLEGIEKPGNMGAIYRSADAAGFDGIIICDARAELYNPNVVRASLGTVFTKDTVICTSTEAIDFLKKNQIKIYASYLEASLPYDQVNYKHPTAIVMGTEATGISSLWVKESDQNIIIPMQGIADSMNVSTATAVLIFEARRQRGFK